MIDGKKIKRDFPIFKTLPELVYLDSTATSLKPQRVIDKENEYYEQYTANIFRGIYKTSEKATHEYEAVREKAAAFIHAPSQDEIIFTRNTTESVNLVMYGLSRTNLHGSELVSTIMEHHSNFVPWQQLAFGFNAAWKIWNVEKSGELKLAALKTLITKKTKLLAITAVSNVLGTINPVKQIVAHVKKLNPACLVFVDAAQAAPHMPIDVQSWSADFVAFSSHKMLGPTGIGVLWGKKKLLEELKPYQYGGEMISAVYPERTEFKQTPHKFEAGTPHIAGVIGFGAALDYLTKLGMENVRAHEMEITEYALKKLKAIDGFTLYGPTDAKKRAGVIAFTLKDAHAHDIAQILDTENVCVRAGNHCAMPLHLFLKVPSTARASFYIYTTKQDIDALVTGLSKVKKMFS